MGFSSTGGASPDDVTLALDTNGAIGIKDTYENSQISRPIAEINIDVIELQAENTLTGMTHDSSTSDTFTDSTGYLNSVVLAGTTAGFDTDKYKRINSGGGVLETSTAVTNAADNGAVSFSVAILKNNTFISKTTLHYNVTGDYTATIKRSGVTLASKTINQVSSAGSVNAFTFDYSDYSSLLMNGDTALVEITGTGNSQRKTGYSFVGTNFTITSQNVGGAHGTGDSQIPCELSEYIASSISIIKIELPVFTGSIIATELVLNCPNRESGDDILYKIVDVDSNEDVDLDITEKNDVVNLTSNPVYLYIYLHPKALSPTNGVPSIKSFCFKVWKA